MSQNKVKLSVIIPFYNEIDIIGETIESVFKESYFLKEFEILICNDGEFNSSEILSKISFLAQPYVKILSNSWPKGPGGARNTGLDNAKGDAIAFLDADDKWLPGKIYEQLKKINEGATFVATGYLFDNGGVKIYPPEEIAKPNDIFTKRGIGTSTVMILSSLTDEVRFKNIRFAQDIDYWYALSKKSNFIYTSLRDELVVYGTNGSTKNKFLQARYLHKVMLLNNIKYTTQSRVFFSYAISGLCNHFVKRFIRSK